MDLNKVLIIKVGGEILVNYKELHPFQGQLKSITKDDYHKLLKSLKKNGMPIALNIWIDEKGKKWISDGHHRCLAFGDMEKDGWFIPPIPCNVIVAANKREASVLLLVGNSTYAHITEESLSDFMIDHDLSVPDLEFLDLSDLDMSQFNLDIDAISEQEDLDSVDENYNFIIKCASHENLVRVQKFFETSSGKVKFATIESKINENSDS